MIGRWNTIDPKAELDRQWSSYVYGLDNAIRFEDPDGMETCDPCVIDANGVTQTNSRMLTAPDPSLNPFSSANVQGAADAEALRLENLLIIEGIRYINRIPMTPMPYHQRNLELIREWAFMGSRALELSPQ